MAQDNDVAWPPSSDAAASPTATQTLKRTMGLGSLLLATLASVIGSGWLFGPLYAARLAGPASMLAWLLGAGMFVLLGLVYAELGTLFPVSGGVVRFPHYAFGAVASYVVGWIIYLGAVTFPAFEVEAALQYATNYLPWLTRIDEGVTVLTVPGYGV